MGDDDMFNEHEADRNGMQLAEADENTSGDPPPGGGLGLTVHAQGQDDGQNALVSSDMAVAIPPAGAPQSRAPLSPLATLLGLLGWLLAGLLALLFLLFKRVEISIKFPAMSGKVPYKYTVGFGKKVNLPEDLLEQNIKIEGLYYSKDFSEETRFELGSRVFRSRTLYVKLA